MSLSDLLAWTKLDGTVSLSWSTLLLSLSLLLLLLFLHRLLRVPNRVERRLRRFARVVAAHPLISHRGGYPENTLSGIRLVKRKGYRAVEVDLEFTKDGIPVLLHDPTVDRTSNSSGCIRDLTFDQVRKLDFGINFG